MAYEGTQFGQWVRRQRQARDLTQRALAAQIGCSESTLRKFEAGTRRPSRELVALLLRFFGSTEAEHPQVMAWARQGGASPPPALPVDAGASGSDAAHNLPLRLTT